MKEWALIVGAGPSLARNDVNKLRAVGLCIAVNCAIYYAPWADTLLAADKPWWKRYGPQLGWYEGDRVSLTYRSPGVELFDRSGWSLRNRNSGHLAIMHAVNKGWRKIALIGFDHQNTNGKSHFHGDHQHGLSNPGNMGIWIDEIDSLAAQLDGVEVVNLSRETAIRCFPRLSVEQFLERHAE